MENSFSRQVKNELCALPLRKRCCRLAFLYGYIFSSRDSSPDGIELRADTDEISQRLRSLFSKLFGITVAVGISSKLTVTLRSELDMITAELGEIPFDTLNTAVFCCDTCRAVFLRAVFICCGRVNTPGAAYHLELSAPDESRSEQLIPLLGTLGLTPRSRANSAGIYFKGSETVEDFLNVIGAQKAAFALMDAKIVRELRNNANRCANCDTANISKTVDAAQSQIEAIERLLASERRAGISEQLLETAKLRVENPDMTLSELAALHNPPITKSGVKHRLDKLVSYAPPDTSANEIT